MTRWQMLGFFTLCLWSSMGWLIDDAFSLPGISTSGQGFRFLLIGVAGLAVCGLHSTDASPPARRCVLVGVVSLGVLGVPILLLTAAQGSVASTFVVLTFALVPVLIVVVGASAVAEPMDLRLLAYGLVGMAGLMVLLPLQLPAGIAGSMGVGLILLAMASTACCLIWLHRLLEGFPTGAAVCAAGIGNGVLLLLAGVSERSGWSMRLAGVEAARCLVVDLPEMVLLMWLTKMVSPQRMSARYLIAPLLTVIEGLVLVRPRFEIRTVVGVVLVGVGAFWILRYDRRGQETSLRLA